MFALIIMHMGEMHWGQVLWAWAAAAVLLAAIVPFLTRLRSLRRWALRAVLILLAMLALARPQWSARLAPPRLIVLVDRSASMPPGWADDMLRRIAGSMRDVELLVFTFAGQADRAWPGEHVVAADPADGSDPGAAVQLALAEAGDQRRPALLLVTDGDWTRDLNWPGDARIWSLCPLAGRANVGIVELLAVPSPASQPGDDGIAVRAALGSTRNEFATVRLVDVPDSARRVALAAGQLRSVDWHISAAAARAMPGGLIRVEVLAEWDELPGDNQMSVLPPPDSGRRTVLLISGSSKPSRIVRHLLPLNDWQVLTASAEEMSDGRLFDSARPPEAVVLENLPASQISPRLLGGLGRYVRAGGALLVVGGPNALAAGHYYESQIESLLPVQSLPTNRPPAAIVLLLDRSGSMNESAGLSMPDQPETTPGSVTRLELIKQAVLGLPDLFTSGDRIAIIGFADQARTEYATAPGEQIDWLAVRRAMLSMNASGGTMIEPGLSVAADWLVSQQIARKHLLLLTDGEFSDMAVERAEQRLRGVLGEHDRLTVSTFATEAQADREFLEELARRFGGTFHPPGKWSDLRERFRDDLAGAMMEPIADGPFVVSQLPGQPALPDVQRLHTTQARPRVEVWHHATATERPRTQPDADSSWPLVAVAQIAAGRSGIIATWLDADWADWSAEVWTSLLRRLLADLAGSGDDPRFILHMTKDSSGQLHVEVHAGIAHPADGAKFIDLLNLHAQLVGADDRAGESADRVPLRQVGPGRYAATLPWRGATALLMTERTAAGAGQHRDRVILRRTLAAPLPPEFLHLSPQPRRLDELSRRHGGRLLDSPEQLAEVRESLRDDRPASRVELWPWLLLAAVTAWLGDVASRRPDHAGHGPTARA